MLRASLALGEQDGSLELFCRCSQSSDIFVTLNTNPVPYWFSGTPFCG